jgi:hypothetical protein
LLAHGGNFYHNDRIGAAGIQEEKREHDREDNDQCLADDGCTEEHPSQQGQSVAGSFRGIQVDLFVLFGKSAEQQSTAKRTNKTAPATPLGNRETVQGQRDDRQLPPNFIDHVQTNTQIEQKRTCARNADAKQHIDSYFLEHISEGERALQASNCMDTNILLL